MKHRIREGWGPALGGLLLAGLVASGAACGGGQVRLEEEIGGGPEPEGRLLVTGSSTLAPLAAEIAHRFEAGHPGVRIDVQTGGSSRGIADVRAGLAQIGMSSRDLDPSEMEGLKTWVAALDGVGFVVHADNPVPPLDREDLKGILTGRIRDWSRVGGNSDPILFIGRTAGRSEVKLVSRYLGIRPEEMRPDLLAGDNQQGLKMLETHPNGLIFLSLGTTEFEARAGRPFRALALEGVPATGDAVREGDYPLTRPLLFVTRSKSDPLAMAWLEFALSGSVEDLVRKLAYIPPGPPA